MQRPPHTDGQSQPDQRQIIDALNAILESDKFTAAPQMSAFLRYVVEQAASGNMTRIKAYTVAIDALGKPDSFDPQNDPVVRVLAGRLRAALASYYEANPETEIRITMRPGSYVPSFVYRSAMSSSDKLQTASLDTNTDASTKRNAKTTGISDASEPAKTQHVKAGTPLNTKESLSQSNAGSTARPATNSGQSGLSKEDQSKDYGAYVRWMFRLPAVGIALAALGVFVGMQLTNYSPQTNKTPASVASASVQNTAMTTRSRPEKVSLFVSAVDQGNPLNNQLNTMISGVFSESQQVRVYRILQAENAQQYWPEDYLVSVDVLPYPEETRISVQLVEAQTGRISHSQNLSLSKDAVEGISAEELDSITKLARDLVGDDGPLFEDYKSKQAVVNAE